MSFHATAATDAGGGEDMVTSTLKAVVAVAFLASFFAPPLGLLISAITIVGAGLRAPAVLPFAVLSYVHSGAVIFASRDFSASSADFLNYFGVYEAIAKASGEQLLDALLEYGPEVGLPALYLALRLVGLGGLSINGLAYLQTFLVSAAILLMFARYAARGPSGRHIAIVVSGTCFVYSFFFSTQLARQALACVFILNALYGNRARAAVAANVLLGTAFHVTAPALLLLVVMLRASWKSAIIVVLASMGTALLGGDLVALALSEGLASTPGLSKLFFYAEMTETSFVLSDWLSVGYLAVAGVASWAYAIRARSGFHEARFLAGMALISAALLPFPLAATRFSLPFASLLGGYYLFTALSRLSWVLATVGVALASAYRIGASLSGGASEHGLWVSYPMYGFLPGYYWHHFVTRL